MQNLHHHQSIITLYARAAAIYHDTLGNMANVERDAMQLMFMTDLDGTLLGHEGFSFAAIRSGIHDLLRAGIMLVPNSSKTAREIDAFCGELGAPLPFICENGAALINRRLMDLPPAPDASDVVGVAPDRLMTLWDRHVDPMLQRHCRFLSELTEAEQAWHLGLRGQALKLAMKRDYSAPFIFSGTEKDFRDVLCQAADGGLAIQRGGRVCNLSARHGKAGFNSGLRTEYRAASRDLVIVGFGDSDNDIDMLEDSDIACVVPRPGSPPLTLAAPPPTVITAQQAAPEGWLEAAFQALSIIERERGETNG